MWSALSYSASLLIITGGYRFRPGPTSGAQGYRQDAADLEVGQKVKARHMGGTPYAKITTLQGVVLHWGNEGEHERYLWNPSHRVEMQETEVRGLRAGQVVWILYHKDDDLSHPPRYNGAYLITSMGEHYFTTHDGEEWPLDGDTSRGQAHYYRLAT